MFFVVGSYYSQIWTLHCRPCQSTEARANYGLNTTQVARKWVLEWRSDGLLKVLSLCATINHQHMCWFMLDFQCLSSVYWDGEDSSAWQPLRRVGSWIRRMCVDTERRINVNSRMSRSDYVTAAAIFCPKQMESDERSAETPHMQLRQALSSEWGECEANALILYAGIKHYTVWLFTCDGH